MPTWFILKKMDKALSLQRSEISFNHLMDKALSILRVSIMKYRRLYREGGTYFFTVVTENRRPILISNIDNLRSAFRHVKKRHPFSIDAIVILPDHLHAIWKLPENDSDFSTRWMLIKKRFSSFLYDFPVSTIKKSRREKGIWQRRFWEHLIRNDEDLKRHYDYIHYNPVKHGYVSKPADWQYSSFHSCVQKGLYPLHWGQIEPENIEGIE